VSSASVRKAALLLTALDSGTAAELLKSARPDIITQIAAELAYINSQPKEAMSGSRADPMREFFGLVRSSRKALPGKGRAKGEDFLREVLESALGKPKSAEMLGKMQSLLEARDPFRSICQASVEELSAALKGESAQVAALVLTELPPRKSAQLLGLLDESVRAETLRGMTAGEEVSPDARQKVAAVIRSRLDKRVQSGAAAVSTVSVSSRRDGQLRKVAVLLRGLATTVRDGLVKSISEQDAATAEAVGKVMVIWDDMPLIPDRALQEILRSVETRKLALALVNAPKATANKIRANISERASAMLDEEMSLLNKPKAEDIVAARETILDPLRTLNAKGELPLEEDA